jgi:hypothetical protein
MPVDDHLISDSLRIQKWMRERSGLHAQANFHGVARQVRGEIVAAFGYDSFQDKGCQLHVCVDKPWGINRTLITAAFVVPFDQWKYDYLIGIIPATNHKSVWIAGRLGFTQCGETRELWFGEMRKENCRWLKLAERGI